jgi:NTP pyrophosphatase (non-canonical NTP hydrolase)
MTDADTTLAMLTDRVTAFCTARDWDQFHGPRDLAIGVVTEAAELLELFRFRTDDDITTALGGGEMRQDVEFELADVLFFVLRLAARHGIDVASACERKLALNESRYPVATSRGSNRKYTEL